ncbi:MAG: hypothetical protein U1F57_11985 [bacterium]
MKPISQKIHSLVFLITFGVLAACSGGGGGDNTQNAPQNTPNLTANTNTNKDNTPQVSPLANYAKFVRKDLAWVQSQGADLKIEDRLTRAVTKDDMAAIMTFVYRTDVVYRKLANDWEASYNKAATDISYTYMVKRASALIAMNTVLQRVVEADLKELGITVVEGVNYAYKDNYKDFEPIAAAIAKPMHDNLEQLKANLDMSNAKEVAHYEMAVRYVDRYPYTVAYKVNNEYYVFRAATTTAYAKEFANVEIKLVNAKDFAYAVKEQVMFDEKAYTDWVESYVETIKKDIDAKMKDLETITDVAQKEATYTAIINDEMKLIEWSDVEKKYVREDATMAEATRNQATGERATLEKRYAELKELIQKDPNNAKYAEEMKRVRDKLAELGVSPDGSDAAPVGAAPATKK